MKYSNPLLVWLVMAMANPLQSQEMTRQTEIMTLGVFHFSYPNLDAVKTDEKDQVSVLEEPWQIEIQAICKALEEFRPTIIAVEFTPDLQNRMDSLFVAYQNNSYSLGKNEVFQLGFRLAKALGLQKVHCVDDTGKHYENTNAIFNDSTRLKKLTDYYHNERNTLYEVSVSSRKIHSITNAFIESNHPERIKERLANYLHHPFKYEETMGDFTGVDFETGRWFNRNLRIFRNIQRLPYTSEDRILLIIGSEHLNLLNHFFEVSKEFHLVSPVPFLEKVKNPF